MSSPIVDHPPIGGRGWPAYGHANAQNVQVLPDAIAWRNSVLAAVDARANPPRFVARGSVSVPAEVAAIVFRVARGAERSALLGPPVLVGAPVRGEAVDESVLLVERNAFAEPVRVHAAVDTGAN